MGSAPVINREWVAGRAVVDRAIVHVPDLQAAEAEFPEGAAYSRLYGHRTTLATPLLREGVAIGAILIRRMDVRPLTEKQITLLKMFADQAVIAFENARLFDEVQARTRELAQSVGELQALGEVSQAVNSTIDLANRSHHHRRQGDPALQHRGGHDLCVRRGKPGISAARDLWNGRNDHRRDQGSPYSARRDGDRQGCGAADAATNC